MKRVLCWYRTLTRTVRNINGLIDFGAYTSGHDYVEQNDGKLKCEVCGDLQK